MGQVMHPNQFPLIHGAAEEEGEVSRNLNAALKFLEGVDYDDDALRRRRQRRAVRAAAIPMNRKGYRTVANY